MRISSFILLILTSFFCAGQKASPLIQTSEKCLGKEVIYPIFDIEVGTNGYVYSTAGSAINRNNGYTSEPLKLDFTSSSVIALYKDYYGQIWFSRFDGGIGYIKEDKIIDCPLPDPLKKLGARGYENIYRDSSGILHIAPKYHGHFTVKDGKIKSINEEPNINGYVITQLCDGHWFHYSQGKNTPDFSVYYQNDTGKKQAICPILEDRSFYQSALVEHKDGSVSLSIGDHSIYRIQNGELVNKHQFEQMIIKLFVDTNNNLWIGTLDHGFFKAENSDLSQLEQVFATGAAAVLTEGIDGSLWFNSDSLMIGRIPAMSMRYYNSQNDYPMFSNLVGITPFGDSILVKNNESQLFILYEDEVNPLIPPKKDHVEDTERFNDLPSVIRYNPVKKELWISYTGLLRKWNGENWNSIFFKDTLFSNLRTIDIICQKNGQVIGTTFREVYEVANNEAVPISEKSTSKITDIEVSPAGQIWVSRKDGVWIMDGKKFKRPPGDLPAMLYNSNNHIVAALGRIWIYNFEGNLVSFENNQFDVELGNQLSASGIGAHFVAANGDLWLFSELHQKILLIREANKKITVNQFQLEHFVQSGFQGRLLLVTEKEIYLSTLDGLLVQKIDQLKKEEMMVNVAINEVRINHKLVPNKKSYELLYNQNNINLSFDGISFYGLPLHYLYKLEGQDTIWTESEYTHVQYTNLAPGTYRFMVRAGIPFNGWNEPIVLTFIIAKPYWKTSEFRVLVGALSLILIWVIYWLNKKRSTRKRKLHYELNRNRQLALRKSMNPHFIFNSLNSIQSFVIRNDTIEANEFIARFGNLMRNYLEANVNESITIRAEMEILDRYVDLEETRLKSAISLIYSVDNKIDIDLYMLPCFMLQPLVENAIWHGLVHRKENRQIKIQFGLKAENLQIQISDNGSGISEKNLDQKTHSTDIFLRRLDLLSQQFETTFEFERKNELNKAGEITGCIVLLTLPKIVLNEGTNY